MAIMTFEQVEQYVIQLKPQEQLQLVARISERLSAIFLPTPKTRSPMQEREEEVNRLLTLCDEAAEMWEGSFDAVEDIRQMRGGIELSLTGYEKTYKKPKSAME